MGDQAQYYEQEEGDGVDQAVVEVKKYERDEGGTKWEPGTKEAGKMGGNKHEPGSE